MQLVGRLTALVGLPLFIIFTLFASGVFFGASRSYRVRVLEAQYLGFEHPDTAFAEAPPTTDAAETEQPQPEPNPAEPEPAKPDPAKPEPAKPEPAKPEPVQSEPAKPEPAKPEGLPVAVADPVGPELRTPFEQRLVVRVKLMVDPSLVVAREDWLAYAATLIDAARASFAVLFGVEVQLQGIVIWDAVNVSGGPEALLADLAEREREGADVILGLVAQPEPEDFEPKSWSGAEHGDHALVYADLRQTDRYHRNLLRTLALLLGATPTTDTAARQLGSFMSDAEAPANAAPVIDPDNRRVVITNKGRPFAGAGKEI